MSQPETLHLFNQLIDHRRFSLHSSSETSVNLSRINTISPHMDSPLLSSPSKKMTFGCS